MNRRPGLARVRLALLALGLASALAACQGTADLTITNGSTIDARVTVTSGDRRSSVVIAPLARATVAVDTGPYAVAVVSSGQGLEVARGIRSRVTAELTSGALERDQIDRIFPYLDEIEARLVVANLTRAGATSCSGSAGGSGAAVAIGQAGTGSNLAYTVTCR